MRVCTVFVIVYLCLTASSVQATESLFVRSVVTDSAGWRSASVVYFTNSGTIAPLTALTLSVTEGGRRVDSLVVNCPDHSPATTISSVLTIDVSGSMRLGGPNLKLATEAASAWVQALEGNSDCAITAFDDGVMLLTDFTKSKSELTEAIQRLKPRGGTDYNKAFNTSPQGALDVASRGRNRRILVFLTDGYGTLDPDSVIRRAVGDSVTVYCVSLGLSMPDVLRTVAEKTGGLWFENVTTVEQALEAYRRIYADAVTQYGCTARWKAPEQCSDHTVIQAQAGNATYQFVDDVPIVLQSRVSIIPSSVRVDSVTQEPAPLLLVCTGSNSTITNISIDRPDIFRLTTPQLPRSLKLGDTLAISVSLIAPSSGYTVGTITISGNPCPLPTAYAITGDPLVAPSRKTLRVVFPNGNEKFPAHSDSVLRWEGLPPDVPVTLEISTNAGSTWLNVQKDAVGNLRLWKVFNISSDSCLFRVTHMVPPDSKKPLLTTSTLNVTSVDLSATGKYLAIGVESILRDASVPRDVLLWDVEHRKLLHTLGYGQIVTFSNDETKLLVMSRDSISLIDVQTGARLWQHTSDHLPSNISVDSAFRVLAFSGAQHRNVNIVDLKSGTSITTIPVNARQPVMVDVAPDGSAVAIAGADSTIRVVHLRAGGGRDLTITKAGVHVFYRAVFTGNGSIIAADDLGTVSSWDVATGNPLRTLSRRQYRNDNTYIAISRDSRKAALEDGVDATRIVDLETGDNMVSIRRPMEPGGASNAQLNSQGTVLLLSTLAHATVYDAITGVSMMRLQRGSVTPSLSADGTAVAVAGPGNVVNVYQVSSPILQQDVSDAMWSIYKITAKLRPVRLRQLAVGQSTDSVVAVALTNTSPDTVRFFGVRIEGAQASDFSVNAPREFILGPGESTSLTYSFHPTKVGERAARVYVQFPGGIINAAITGRCVGGVIAADGRDVDLGTVAAGTVTNVTVDDLLVNQGLHPVTVTNIQVVGSSVIIPAFEQQFSLQPAERRNVDVEIRAPEPGIFTTQAIVTVQGIPDPIEIRFVVRVVHPDSLLAHHDPTTFRGIMLPTALVPKAGTLTTGVYNALGLSATYSITNAIAVVAGGMIPLPSRWLGATGYNASWSAAWSAGAKFGLPVAKNVIVGGGIQAGQSLYNQDYSAEMDSRITFSTLWATAGYGTDDSRLNIHTGFTFKHHETLLEGAFRADATILGIGYDYRIADQWKLCFEAFAMRTMPFIPVSVVGRYFRADDAFEVGFTYLAQLKEGSGWPVFPLLSWVKRW